MKFLIFYIISTVICVAIVFIVSDSFKNRFKREYPILSTKKITKRSLSESISGLLVLFIPVINILFGLVFIFNQEFLYKRYLAKILEIYTSDQKLNKFDWTLDSLEEFYEEESKNK